MNAIRIRTQVDSETLHLPELRPFIGKSVDIVVQEAPCAGEKDWKPLVDVAHMDLVDPDVYRRYREFDRQHNAPPGL